MEPMKLNNIFSEKKVLKFTLKHSLGLLLGNVLMLAVGIFFVKIMQFEAWKRRFVVQSQILQNGFVDEIDDREMLIMEWASENFRKDKTHQAKAPALDIVSQFFNEGPEKYEFKGTLIPEAWKKTHQSTVRSLDVVKVDFSTEDGKKEAIFTICHRPESRDTVFCAYAKSFINMQQYTVKTPLIRNFRFDLIDSSGNLVAEYFPFNMPFTSEADYSNPVLQNIGEQVKTVSLLGQEYFTSKVEVPRLNISLMVMAPIALFKQETAGKDRLYFSILFFIAVASFLINFEAFRRKILLPAMEIQQYEKVISRELGDTVNVEGDTSDLHLIRFFFEKLYKDIQVFKTKESDYRKQLMAEVRKLESERKQTISQVIQMEKMSVMSRLMAGVAHEIKNPLTSIKLAVDNLKMAKDGFSEKQSSYMDVLSEEVARLSSMLDRFLGLGKKSSGSTYVKMNLNQIVNQIVQICYEDFKAKDIVLEVFLDPEMVDIRLIYDEMTSAIMNLVKNAIESCPRGGRVRITAVKAQSSVILTVEDSGDGVPEEMKDRIFDIFFTTKSQGSGLGLPQVLQAVSLHHGEIEIERSHLGGALFQLTLPIEK